MGRLLHAGAMRWLTLLAFICVLLTPAQTALAASVLGTTSRTLLTPIAPADVFTVGTRAVVATSGDVLRLRATPSITGALLASLNDGTAVTVAEGRVSADGYWWQRIQANALTGW